MHEDNRAFSLLRRLWIHVSYRRRLQLAGLCGLMLLGTAAEVLSLGMVLPFLGVLTAPDRVFQHAWMQPIIVRLGLTEPQQLLLPLTVLFALAAVLAGTTRLALLWGQTRLAHGIANELGSEAYRRTLYQPYAVHLGRNSSDVIAVLMAKVNTVAYYVVIAVLSLTASIVIVLTMVVFLLLLDPKLTATTFAAFGCFYAIAIYTTKNQLARDSHRASLGDSRLARVVQEGLGGIRNVLIDGLQETYCRIYRKEDTELRRALANITIVGGAPRPVIEGFGLVLIAWLAYDMSTRPEGMMAAIPILGALALAAQRMLPLVQQGYNSWTSIAGGLASLSDVLELLEQPLPRYLSASTSPVSFRDQITLHDLHFSYGREGGWILQGVNLKIPRGSRTGIIGATGSGKSTLLDILMGLLSPTAGTLRVDGVVVDQLKSRAWQAHIAHVPQDIYLADSSIAENIAFGEPVSRIDMERVKRAARCAQIAETIESWPAGYDTFVGERGVRLSGGQRQRVGIARALYKQADVIVLDEATSALDSTTERAVMESIDSLSPDLTLVIVTHRLTTLKNCDQVIELKSGVVSRVGTYLETVAEHLDGAEPVEKIRRLAP